MSVSAICLNFEGILAAKSLSEISQVGRSRSGGLPGAWKRICARLCQNISQDEGLDLILRELCAFEVVAGRTAIFHLSTYFVARTIRRIPYGTLIRAIQTEFPEVEEIRIHRGTL